MKKCPYCDEEIQDEAIKCRFCGEWFERKEKVLKEEHSQENISTKKINISSLPANILTVASINDKPKPEESKEIKTDLSSSDDIKIFEGKTYILQKDQEGEVFCSGCGSVDALKNHYYCKENDQYYHSVCFSLLKKEPDKISISRPVWSPVIATFFLIVIGLAYIGMTTAVLISPTPTPPMTLFAFAFWAGVIAAIIARKKGKSGWLWFFIGFIPIGFSIVFVLSFLRTILHHH